LSNHDYSQADRYPVYEPPTPGKLTSDAHRWYSWTV